MSIDSGMKAVNDLLTAPRIDKCIVELILTARDRAAHMAQGPDAPPGYPFGIAGCDTKYKPGHHELDTWVLSILFGEYTAGLLAQKAAEGHCNRHRVAPAMNPCLDMRREHLRMLTEFKAALQALVDEIGTKVSHINSLSPTPPSSASISTES